MLNFRGGCDNVDEYEMEYNDATGYNDVGALDENTGCTGGHNECPDCTYQSQRQVSPGPPQFVVDTLGGDLYWNYYVIDHTTSECSADCYQDDNPHTYGGAFGNFFYECYQ